MRTVSKTVNPGSNPGSPAPATLRAGARIPRSDGRSRGRKALVTALGAGEVPIDQRNDRLCALAGAPERLRIAHVAWDGIASQHPESLSVLISPHQDSYFPLAGEQSLEYPSADLARGARRRESSLPLARLENDERDLALGAPLVGPRNPGKRRRLSARGARVLPGSRPVRETGRRSARIWTIVSGLALRLWNQAGCFGSRPLAAIRTMSSSSAM